VFKDPWKILVYFMAVSCSVISFAPLFYIFWTSIKPEPVAMDPSLWFFVPQWDAYYKLIFESALLGKLLNSLIVASSTTVLSLIVGAFGGYSLARGEYKGREGILMWVLTNRMAPPIAAIIPLFIIFYRMGLYDTQIGLIIAYLVFNLPISIWMLKSYFEDLPKELEDNALVDGCRPIDVFLRIVLPLSQPGIVATGILTFMLCWNEFFMAMILTGGNAGTLPLFTLTFIAEYRGTLWGQMAATGVITMIPVVVLAVLVQKHLIRGLTLGAVKG
jgi:multiple sugar transport system permease protein